MLAPDQPGIYGGFLIPNQAITRYASELDGAWCTLGEGGARSDAIGACPKRCCGTSKALDAKGTSARARAWMHRVIPTGPADARSDFDYLRGHLRVLLSQAAAGIC